MSTVILNNIEFEVSNSDGEFWFQSDRKLHHKTLEKCIREAEFDSADLRWVSPKNGNFSVAGAQAVEKMEFRARVTALYHELLG